MASHAERAEGISMLVQLLAHQAVASLLAEQVAANELSNDNPPIPPSLPEEQS